MKQAWSPSWKASTQPRKQRKYLANAPLHTRHKFLSANLSKLLQKQHSRRSFPVRKGDEVEVMRGKFKKFKGQVERVSLKKTRIYVQGVKRKKVDGTETLIGLAPSNIRITKISGDDKKRVYALTRMKAKPAETKSVPKEEKK